MGSLRELTTDKLISSLPEECINGLVGRAFRRHLYTFQKIKIGDEPSYDHFYLTCEEAKHSYLQLYDDVLKASEEELEDIARYDSIVYDKSKSLEEQREVVVASLLGKKIIAVPFHGILKTTVYSLEIAYGNGFAMIHLTDTEEMAREYLQMNITLNGFRLWASVYYHVNNQKGLKFEKS